MYTNYKSKSLKMYVGRADFILKSFQSDMTYLLQGPSSTNQARSDRTLRVVSMKSRKVILEKLKITITKGILQK